MNGMDASLPRLTMKNMSAVDFKSDDVFLSV